MCWMNSWLMRSINQSSFVSLVGVSFYQVCRTSWKCFHRDFRYSDITGNDSNECKLCKCYTYYLLHYSLYYKIIIYFIYIIHIYIIYIFHIYIKHISYLEIYISRICVSRVEEYAEKRGSHGSNKIRVLYR